jgi:hypothetical protein
MRRAKRRPTMGPAPLTTTTVDNGKHIAPRCRECEKTLTAPKPIKRGVCRSCWRVFVVCDGGAR